ncbi:MAG TPA: hypothetical protein VFG69_14930 [Nannocystaceae bacterium]|nr:hypothetical protein [Nannocystaceae bacterium]
MSAAGHSIRIASALAVALAAACAADTLADSPETGDGGGVETTTGGADETSGRGPASSTGALDDAATGSLSATTSSEGDESPIGFDLGREVDAPGQDMRCESEVDVVFVMDVSTSMGAFLSTLADEIIAVDTAIQELGLATQPHYGLAVFVDDYLLVGGGTPYDDVGLLAADFDMWSTFTGSNSQVNGGGFNTTFPENSLDPLFAAATDFDWRPLGTTTRIVIHTTDDTFSEAPAVVDGIPVEHDYVDTVDALQDEQVRVFAFAAMLGGPSEFDDVSMGWFVPYGAELAIPVATDGGVYNIDDVLAGTVSLGDAIVAAVEDSHCDPYTPQG